MILKSLKVRNKNKLICNVQFVPSDFECNPQGMFSTVIIGVNGSGKSYLLKLIIDIIRRLEAECDGRRLKAVKSMRYDDYFLSFEINKLNINIQIKENKLFLFVNEKEVLNAIKDIKDILPSNLLAVGFMVNDKFVFDRGVNSIYQYNGVRTTSNSTQTKSIERKLVKMRNLCDAV